MGLYASLVDTLRRPMLQEEDCTLSETVSVAQLVERQTVDLDVAGSNPVAHPKRILERLKLSF